MREIRVSVVLLYVYEFSEPLAMNSYVKIYQSYKFYIVGSVGFAK